MAIKLSHGTEVPNVFITKGMRLAAARKHADLTQARMAELLGCSKRTIIRYETEDAASSAVAMAYSLATNVNLAWIETGTADLDSTADHFEWATSVNDETPAEAGVSRNVRHKGFEPLTFWLGDSDLELALLLACETTVHEVGSHDA